MTREKFWLDEWATPEYLQGKIDNFKRIERYLIKIEKAPPVTILDIGCGLAFESQFFQEKYDSDLYLMDSDSDANGPHKNRDILYGTVGSFQFYQPADVLVESWKSRNMDYNFVDARNPEIDKNIKFDLIYSFYSCGFHYPVSTYRDFLQWHTTDETVIILDIRTKPESHPEEFVVPISTIYEAPKHDTVHVDLSR